MAGTATLVLAGPITFSGTANNRAGGTQVDQGMLCVKNSGAVLDGFTSRFRYTLAKAHRRSCPSTA